MNQISPRDLGEKPASELGTPRFNRRLSDKILAAFTHAYASGEQDVANQLRGALVMSEKNAVAKYTERRQSTAVLAADHWVTFIEARNKYKTLCERAGGGDAPVDAALQAMKDAYIAWSNMG